MLFDKNSVINEISSAFSLSDEAARTALLLLEARARTLDFTFDEYMSRYHPEGIARRDENLGEQWQGYVQFLGDDATAILRAGKGADFPTFVHECAHVFRRQLTGEFREQAEKAFGVENGTWDVEKEELFAKGLEQWIKRRHGRDKTRADVYSKGKTFVDTVYRGMEHIVEIDSRMEAVYERLFEDDKYRFSQNVYEKTLSDVAEGKMPKDSHIFLGMTPRIYEELGFLRLPMAITNMHLYTTLRSSGLLPEFNYHDLGEEILRQLPKQLKNPLLIVQSPNDESEIISIIELADKNGETIIVPVSQYQKGNVNGTEIDINLVKSLYGKKGFEKWLEEAVDDNRLLYINKKETEPALNGKLTHTFQSRSILPPGLKPPDVLQNISGFLNDNITRYQQAVKLKYPERFAPSGERVLYKSSQNQLDFNFSLPPAVPLPNSPENFKQNFAAIAGKFKKDTIEAARFLLRSMTKEDRAASLADMQNAGCSDRESYHKYLYGILSSVPSPEQKQKEEAVIAEAANNFDSEKPNITAEKIQNVLKYNLYTDIGLDLHHGRISIENAYNSMLELRKKQINDSKNHIGPLGAPITPPPQPAINGLHMEQWRFAAQ
jgi:hypothetical protein